MKLSSGQHVTLGVRGREPLPATVEHDDGEVVTVVLALRDSGRVQAGTVRVDATSSRGLVTLTGSVVADPKHPEVLLVRRDGSEEVVQRRDQVRVVAAVPVEVRPVEPAGAPFATSTLDLSGGGMLIRDEGRLPDGAVVDLSLVAEDAPQPIRARAQVARRPSSQEVGLHVIEASRADEQRLARLVMEHQRRALRLAKSGR